MGISPDKKFLRGMFSLITIIQISNHSPFLFLNYQTEISKTTFLKFLFTKPQRPSNNVTKTLLSETSAPIIFLICSKSFIPLSKLILKIAVKLCLQLLTFG